MIKVYKKPNILVIGDLMIDEYLWGSCERISPEAPVQIVDINKETYFLGGAGNVVSNLLSLGANVELISVIGDDEVGKDLRNMLLKLDVKSILIEEKNRKTSKKTRLMASHSQVVRYDKESKNPITAQSVNKLFKEFIKRITSYDTILLSDYAKGVLTSELIEKIITYANEKNIKVLVDPKGNDFSKYKGAYLLTPNKKESEIASDIKIVDDNSLKRCLEILKDKASLAISLITLSDQGIAVLQNDRVTVNPTLAREVYDVTGAGDTVLASLGFALSLENDIKTSIEFANLAAGIVVGKLGSATVSIEEIEEYEASLNKNSIEFNIKSQNEIVNLSIKLKKENKKIVFTNGCFDILHKGHISYLNTAKSLGDILILGLNSDASVKRLKGENRPINCEDDRAYILSALECVDYVVIFDEDTPYRLIKSINPNILVKGADYEGKEVVGSDIVEQIKLVEFIDGKSTTKTIEKIQKVK